MRKRRTEEEEEEKVKCVRGDKESLALAADGQLLPVYRHWTVLSSEDNEALTPDLIRLAGHPVTDTSPHCPFHSSLTHTHTHPCTHT